MASHSLHMNVSDNSELNEISQLTGLNLWQQSQEVLEQQALQQIEILSKKTPQLDDLIKNNNNEDIPKNQIKGDIQLNLEEFIKKQEKLKKLHDQKKLSEVSEKSRLIANNISLNRNNDKKSKRKSDHHYTKTKKLKVHENIGANSSDKGECLLNKNKTLNKSNLNNLSTENEKINDSNFSDEDYVPSNNSSDESDEERLVLKKSSFICPGKKVIDDGCLEAFNARLDFYYKKIETERDKLENEDLENLDDVILKGGLKIPAKTWANLYSYQQYGVEWLWKLHQSQIGGLLGDEMGLGKTVQVIVFLMSLQYSAIVGSYRGLGPTLIVCPATVMYQWVEHFHEWGPEIRVAVLHHSGSFSGNKNKLIKELNNDQGVLITTYSGILKYQGNLIEHSWHYLILDEGHKIRNPSAKVTIALKKFRTPHRLLLTGSPMQNNLQELWSLFDFIIPGILGTQQTFMEHFANPIIQGGYHNSTQIQEATAQSVASTLKDIISPYLLRRTKAEVQRCIQLPYKSEQVLFCSLTDEQYDLYKGFLMSDHINQILGRGGKNWFAENRVRANVLVAITTLRKICNHPDLYLEESDHFETPPDNLALEENLGYYKRSGKMIVVSALLKMWKKQNHRVLLFTQTRTMISIFENFLTLNEYKYLKMDGSTSVTSRQTLIKTFNNDTSYDVFLLTTRVGGLGVNLTGANRVIIYDPDWNPATDTQARERAWRIGQEKEVTVYRLVSAGTIEEKMYQRQIWKQLLSNKVLLDARTQKIFKTSDLHDLFSLQEQNKYTKPETTNIFRDSVVNMKERLEEKQREKKEKIKKDNEKLNFSEEKVEQMKLLAKQISQSIKANEDNKGVKTLSQLEIEEEKEQRLKEKEKIKNLTPNELLIYNRKKLEPKEELFNTIDDQKIDNFSFEKALEYSEKTAKLYNNLKTGKIKENQVLATKITEQSDVRCLPSTSEVTKDQKMINEKKYEQKRKKKIEKVDTSGKIEGNKIEGLVKREVKRLEKVKTDSDTKDMFILEKLFNKKGVHSVLKHDEIVSGPRLSEAEKIRVSSEAKRKADLALEALRKSRLKNWRW